MTTLEPEWDQRSRDEHVAGLLIDDRSCASCGTDLALSMDADLAAAGVDVNEDGVCWVCAAKEERRHVLDERHEKDPSWWYGRALTAQLVTTDRPTDDESGVT